MSTNHKALCWAAALILLALAARNGLISQGSAKILFIVLPLIAWLSLRQSGSCRPLRRRSDPA